MSTQGPYTKSVDWAALVRKIAGKDQNAPVVVYEFSGPDGKKVEYPSVNPYTKTS
jgi:hypothetical protein